MSEPKTKPTAEPVKDFLDRAATERRIREGHQLHRLFTEASGEDGVMWGTAIVGYGAMDYQHGVWPKVGFSPRKAKLSLYGLKDLPDGRALLPALGKYTEGAGCVYVNKLEDIDLDVLRQLVSIASKGWPDAVSQSEENRA